MRLKRTSENARAKAGVGGYFSEIKANANTPISENRTSTCSAKP